MQDVAKAGLTIAAVLTIGAGIAYAAPPKNAPGGPPCHYKQVCVTKNRVCPPAVPNRPRTTACTPGPYQACTQQRVCADP